MISENGMSDFFHMNSELMGSSGEGVQSYQTAGFVWSSENNGVLGYGLSAVVEIHYLIGAVGKIGDQWKFDYSLWTFWFSVNPGIIDF